MEINIKTMATLIAYLFFSREEFLVLLCNNIYVVNLKRKSFFLINQKIKVNKTVNSFNTCGIIQKLYSFTQYTSYYLFYIMYVYTYVYISVYAGFVITTKFV